MQSTVGTTLPASRTAENPAVISLLINWNGDGTTFVEENTYVLSADGTYAAVDTRAGIAAVGHSIADSWTIVLDNGTRRFTPWNSGGALYSNIASGAWKGKKARVKLGYRNNSSVAETLYVFYGHIDELTPAVSGMTAVLQLVDKSAPILEHNAKSQLFQNYRVDEIVEQYRQVIPSGYRPNLTADKSIYSIPWAYIDDENIWAELSWLAQAEGGRIYFSQATGNLVFENAAHLLSSPHDTSQATFAIGNWAELIAQHAYVDYKNHIEVYYTPYRLCPRQEIWTSADTVIVKPGATETIKAVFNAPAYIVDTPIEDKDYIAVTAGSARISSEVSLVVVSYGGQASIAITNNSNYTAFFVRLRLMGRPVYAADQKKVEAEDATGIAERSGRRTLPIKSNPYIQTREHAQALANFLLDRYKVPRMTCQLRDLDGMPWLEVGDRVTVTEYNGELAADFFVQAITWHFSSERGMSMDLELLQADDLFPYTDYFVLGTSTLGSGSATQGRAFY